MLPRALMISKARAMKRELQGGIAVQRNLALLKTNDRCGEKNDKNACDGTEKHLVPRCEKFETFPRTRCFGTRREATLICRYVCLKFLYRWKSIVGSERHCFQDDMD